MSDLADLIEDTEVLLCCGTGGVGKTTTAAALALAAAQAGRRAVVVTIDPARRLADALGLEGIDNSCVRVDGVTPGELWVTMLDTKATFDALIERHAADPSQAERILSNRYYRNLSSTLSGTREFMAMERLYELHHDPRFDLVVVDTPPSRNALEAPDKLARFLDGRLFRMATPGRKITKRVTAPLILFLRRVARVISPEVVDDTLAFIEAFSGMEEGFKLRAAAVDALLADDRTGFVLVAAPMAEGIEESIFFATRLTESEVPVRGLVINRRQPRFTARPMADLAALADDDTLPAAERAQVGVLRDLTALADAEDRQLEPLIELCHDAAIANVEQFENDVHDLDGITEVAGALVD